jgi:hypothetical protein
MTQSIYSYHGKLSYNLKSKGCDLRFGQRWLPFDEFSTGPGKEQDRRQIRSGAINFDVDFGNTFPYKPQKVGE